jgi:hypothetical protein
MPDVARRRAGRDQAEALTFGKTAGSGLTAATLITLSP